jgi:RecA-family ATPase
MNSEASFSYHEPHRSEWLGEEPPEVEQLRQKRQTERDDNLARYLTISDEPWDEASLRQRPWLASPYMMRGQITLLHGPGAAGKSMLIIVWAVALALGMAFGRG